MQLARPPRAGLIGGLDAQAQPGGGHRARGGDRGGGAGRDRHQQLLVLLLELALAGAVDAGQHAQRLAPEDQRNEDRGLGVRRELLELGRVRFGADAPGASATAAPRRPASRSAAGAAASPSASRCRSPPRARLPRAGTSTSVRAATISRPWARISDSTRSSSVSPPTARAISANASSRSTLRASPRLLASSWSAYSARSRWASWRTAMSLRSRSENRPTTTAVITKRGSARDVPERVDVDVVDHAPRGHQGQRHRGGEQPGPGAELDGQHRDRDDVEVGEQRIGVVDRQPRGERRREQQRWRSATIAARLVADGGGGAVALSRSMTRRWAASSSICRARAAPALSG